ncbi:hypothetical protein OEV98_06855 [Caldibacillus lycopersici]|uniref:Uncharacterized protein n=1 Tax=Perspicuibacillus lycopersici TaxID=1325689 RepID=A0AAE3LMT7_9BACI|nr:hypothetical protein [Perspicuibacillus lycopersici]MCU9613271.1 hypothetical protein [Perspicuibacillus lycopersici]
MQRIPDSFQLEEMVQLLIRIVGKSNEKMVEMDRRVKQLEAILKTQGIPLEGITGVQKVVH